MRKVTVYNFEEVLVALKSGKKIKRVNWDGHWKLTVFGQLVLVSTDGFGKNITDTARPLSKDIFASDWEIIDD
ncbi:Thoeris anti-defense Tad2 family protein [Peribacillus sp. SCS-155]|uniref:Thoeris anti-defense Tad2 family protein n=1 Tax=Peribacillus sedimenti TaxID=3115297 RepID=UPI0039061B02